MIIKKLEIYNVKELDELAKLRYSFSEEERINYNIPGIIYYQNLQEANKDLRRFLDNKNNKIYLILKNKELIGFYSIYKVSNNLIETIELTALYLIQKERSKGIGTEIIKRLIKLHNCDKFIVRTAKKNFKAHSFYNKNGFIKDNVESLKSYTFVLHNKQQLGV